MTNQTPSSASHHPWLDAVVHWITETTRESRLARLSTIGLNIPCDAETTSERWHEVIWLRER